ncbi:MAG: BrxA family protein [Candidatus Brocadiia bacterium]
MTTTRSQEVSSFTIVKGGLIEETYLAFQNWDFDLSKRENLQKFREEDPIGATSANMLDEVAMGLSRRFEPNTRDRPLVELAKAGCEREVWEPLLLWHMTRDEFLVRDFLLNWLFPRYEDGALAVQANEVIPYLKTLPEKGVTSTDSWADSTLKRVASGLLRIAVDFGLMTGRVKREFASYHLPDDSFMYLLHALAEQQSNANHIVQSDEWRMYLITPRQVERRVLQLHQYNKLDYHVAGTLAQLSLPAESTLEYARGMIS